MSVKTKNNETCLQCGMSHNVLYTVNFALFVVANKSVTEQEGGGSQ